MRRRVAALGALLFALSACTTSEVAADAKVSIVGTYRHQSGEFARNVRVSLLREADVGEGFMAFTSVGLSCVGDTRKLAACSHGHDTQTDEKGNFAFDLTGRDTHGFFGNAATLELIGLAPRAEGQYEGAATTMRFQVQTERLAFPLRFWEPTLKASTDGPKTRVEWTAMPPSVVPGEVSVARLQHVIRFESAGGERVWAMPVKGTTATIDSRILEDSNGTVAVGAEAFGIKVRDSIGRNLDVILRTPRFPYEGSSGAPDSRDATCSVPGADGKPVTQAPCRLTDGDFTREFNATPCPSGSEQCATQAPSQTTIDLQRSIEITLIVLRGCRAVCTVDVSSDNRSWRPVATTPEAVGDAAIPVPKMNARYVRVTAVGALGSLREVSVWDSLPPAAPPRSILGTVSGLAPVAGDTSRAWIVIVAGLALALVAGVFLGTRLRRKTASG